MATIDYDISWPTEFCYDVLQISKVARVRALLVEVADLFGAQILGTARVRDGGIHVRARVEDTVPMQTFIKYLKGQLSFALANEDAAIKSDYKGKGIFGRTYFKATGNPGNAIVDTFLDSHQQFPRPV